MKVVYEIKNSYGAIKDDCKAFVLGGNEELVVKVEGAQINKCFILLENGDKTKKLSVENLDEFVVPADLLQAGELKIKIAQFNRTKVRTINLESITLIAQDEGFAGHSAFDDLKARVEELEKKVDTLLPLLQEIKELHIALEQ